jgi:hypothetical protein
MSEPRERVLLRIPASLKAKLSELAERDHRSLNKEIEFLLEQAIREDANEKIRQSQHQKTDHAKRK